MPKYKIPVSYQMAGIYEIEAESLEEATNIVNNFDVNMDNMPKDAYYVDSSVEVNEQMIPFLNGEKGAL